MTRSVIGSRERMRQGAAWSGSEPKCSRTNGAALEFQRRHGTDQDKAIGSWSGGRFMHFGEPLPDERLISSCDPATGLTRS